jgi:hypothetical protein
MVVAAYILHEHHAKHIPMHRGSMKRRRANVLRNRVGGHVRLYKDYFHLTDPVYKKHMFRRRYWMLGDLFMVILQGIRDYDPLLSMQARYRW